MNNIYDLLAPWVNRSVRACLGVNRLTGTASRPDEIGMIILPGLQSFSPQEIGEPRYRATMASLSRSCRRLQERGLVTCLVGAGSHWSCVQITDKGREWLSVNLAVN